MAKTEMKRMGILIVALLVFSVLSISATATFTITTEGWRAAEDFSGNPHPAYRYATKTFNVPEGTTKVRITHSGTDTAHIDAVLLDGKAPLEFTEKLAAADYDVIDAVDRTVELSWNNPGKTLTVSAVAEDLKGEPHLWPVPSYETFDLSEEKTFRYFVTPYSSHPAAEVQATFSTTSSSLELYLDRTTDNTLDYGGDWAELRVLTSSGVKKFRIDSDDDTWGTSAYEYTDAVPWQHKTYRFSIPLTEFGSDTISFQIAYYGTESAPTCEDIDLVPGPQEACSQQPSCYVGIPPEQIPCWEQNGACCVVPSEPESGNLFDVFLGFDIAENLLKNKILSMLHIIKEEAIQIELKMIEVSLASDTCQNQPLSFKLSKEDYIYGKLEEVDKLVTRLANLVDENEAIRPGAKIDEAMNLLFLSEQRIDEGDPFAAYYCKYWAYRALLGEEINPEDPSCLCEPPPVSPCFDAFDFAGTENIQGFIDGCIAITGCGACSEPSDNCQICVGGSGGQACAFCAQSLVQQSCENICEVGPFCGDNVVNQESEECDGDDVSACDGLCHFVDGLSCTCVNPLPCFDANNYEGNSNFVSECNTATGVCSRCGDCGDCASNTDPEACDRCNRILEVGCICAEPSTI